MVMLTRLHERLRASLWFVPGLTAAAAFVGAKILVMVDGRIDQSRSAWFLFSGEPESAREILSTAASSTMTFAGLVFSITILVLQLASNQFSPRVLRTFLEDRVTQIAMAAFVGSFVFSMALLPDVRSAHDGADGFVPGLSVFVAFILVLLSVGVFIHYIDHMAHAVRAISIIKRVSGETRRWIGRLYPEEVAPDPADLVRGPTAPPSQVLAHQHAGGVLSAVDERPLLELARREDLVLALVPRPGDYVPRGAPLFRVWGTFRGERGKIEEAVFISAERSPHQDPAFGFRQLVDIAERALSPSLNDPSTAVQALDEIHDLLRMLAPRRFPSSLRLDEAGAVRLIVPRPDWEGYVHLAFDEIRHHGAGSIQIARRMRAAIEDLIQVAPADRRAALEEQRALLEEGAREQMKTAADRRLATVPSAQGHGQE
jgi:uncharacterized membrane protein